MKLGKLTLKSYLPSHIGRIVLIKHLIVMKKNLVWSMLVLLGLSSCNDDLNLAGKNDSQPAVTASIDGGAANGIQSGIPGDTTLSITSFSFDALGVEGEIVMDPFFGTNTRVINCVVPDSTSLVSLVPTIHTTQDVSMVSTPSGVARNFSGIPQAFYVYTSSKPYPVKYYYANVNYENDFLIFSGRANYVVAGQTFELSGNFGLPLTDYKARYQNVSTGEVVEITSGFDKNIGKGYLLVPVPTELTPGQYKLTISRRSIEKEVPGFITVK